MQCKKQNVLSQDIFIQKNPQKQTSLKVVENVNQFV